MQVHTLSSVGRALRGPALLLVGAVAIAACGTGTASAPAGTTAGGGATIPPATKAASTAPSIAPASAGPSPLALMPVGLLPQAEVPKDVKVSCEDTTGATLSCEDAVALAARMAITMTGASPIQQVLVERDAADANVVTITFWAIDPEAPDDPAVAFSTTVDVAAQTMTFPTQNDEAVFPS
jgi:hypothetical protein